MEVNCTQPFSLVSGPWFFCVMCVCFQALRLDQQLLLWGFIFLNNTFQLIPKISNINRLLIDLYQESPIQCGVQAKNIGAQESVISLYNRYTFIQAKLNYQRLKSGKISCFHVRAQLKCLLSIYSSLNNLFVPMDQMK